MLPDLGRFELCIGVKDLEASIAFYQKLGFAIEHDKREMKYVGLRGHGLILALYGGYFEGVMLNFRGGDVFAIAKALEAAGVTFDTKAHTESDGSNGAIANDPDGIPVYFNTAPGEKP